MDYEQSRSEMRSGDLVAWGGGHSDGFFSTFVEKAIRMFTMSEYHHVGILWCIGQRVFVVEAVYPKVRIYPLSKRGSFYHLPMAITWTDKHEESILRTVGDPYSVVQAIVSLFGSPNKDKQWQCAEYASHFYKLSGYDLEETGYTPGRIVSELMRRYGKTATFINQK